ncbi:hypothetical protein GGE65_004705 [Skermanella aerolata]|uniref:hypothetical protein n=1 Tax=Skermanella aerolata TaxID=393310 RepID=UPI003D1BDC82
MNANEIAALCGDLIAAHGAADAWGPTPEGQAYDALSPDARYPDVYVALDAALDALMAAQPDSMEAARLKARGLIEEQERSGLDYCDDIIDSVLADAERLAGLPARQLDLRPLLMNVLPLPAGLS